MEEKEINSGSSSPESELTLAERNAQLRKARAEQKNARIEERNKKFAEATMLNEENAGSTSSSADDNNTASQQSADDKPDSAVNEESSEANEIASAKVTDADEKSSKKKKEKKKRRPSPVFSIISIFLSAIALVFMTIILLSKSEELFPQKEGTEVVYINVADSSASNRDPDKAEDIAGYSGMLEKAMDSVVIVHAKQNNDGESTGTGIILSSDGYILTNFHVISGATQVRVKLRNSSNYVQAKVIGYKTHDDIAVLKVDLKDLPAATIGKSSSCRAGDRVFAIGCPQGIDYAWSVTQGIISAPDRDLKIYDTTTGIVQKKMRVIQTDTPVNPGNSGGPLINTSGHVLGIITLKLTDTSGMGFALPIDQVMIMVEGIIEHKLGETVESTIASGRPLLGITCVAVESRTFYALFDDRLEVVDSDYASKYPNSTIYCSVDGILVRGTNPGSDAEKKLKSGDIITHIGGDTVTTANDVTSIINNYYGGDSLEITYVRDGKSYNTTIILSEDEIK